MHRLLELPAEEAPTVALDFETTGLTAADDRVVEIGVLRVDNGTEDLNPDDVGILLHTVQDSFEIGSDAPASANFRVRFIASASRARASASP